MTQANTIKSNNSFPPFVVYSTHKNMVLVVSLMVQQATIFSTIFIFNYIPAKVFHSFRISSDYIIMDRMDLFKPINRKEDNIPT